MEHACRRRSGVRAKVRLLLAFALAFLGAAEARAAPFQLEAQAGELGVVVYPATTPGPHRVTVVLHGMCGEPLNTCSHFAGEVTESEHLVCPRANQRCEGGGASWSSSGFEQQIERAVVRAEAALGEAVDGSQGRTLIGYSLGAFRALDVAQHGAGKYPRVMLVGARLAPSPKLLRENGVERLLLSAGAFDMTYEHMQHEAQHQLAFPRPRPRRPRLHAQLRPVLIGGPRLAPLARRPRPELSAADPGHPMRLEIFSQRDREIRRQH
jgi:predicted esterase